MFLLLLLARYVVVDVVAAARGASPCSVGRIVLARHQTERINDWPPPWLPLLPMVALRCAWPDFNTYKPQ